MHSIQLTIPKLLSISFFLCILGQHPRLFAEESQIPVNRDPAFPASQVVSETEESSRIRNGEDPHSETELSQELANHVGIGTVYWKPHGALLLDILHAQTIFIDYNHSESMQFHFSHTQGNDPSLFTLFFPGDSYIYMSEWSLAASSRFFPQADSGWFFGGGTGAGRTTYTMSSLCSAAPSDGLTLHKQYFVTLFAEMGWQLLDYRRERSFGMNAYLGPKFPIGESGPFNDLDSNDPIFACVSREEILQDMERTHKWYYGVGFTFSLPW